MITFIIPVKDPHRWYFNKALASLMHQTDPRWQGIVVSEAGDPAMEGWRPPDDRIWRLTNEGKLLSGAINTGLLKVGTEFAAVLLGDDQLTIKAVQTLNTYAETFPAADFFHSSMRYIDGSGKEIRDSRESRPLAHMEDFLTHGVTHLMCFRVAKALAIGGVDENLGLHGADDYDFPWTMWERGAKFQDVPETLYEYRIHHDHYRLTTHVPKEIQKLELRKIFAKHGLPPDRIEREIAARESGYLDQALS